MTVRQLVPTPPPNSSCDLYHNNQVLKLCHASPPQNSRNFLPFSNNSPLSVNPPSPPTLLHPPHYRSSPKWRQLSKNCYLVVIWNSCLMHKHISRRVSRRTSSASLPGVWRPPANCLPPSIDYLCSMLRQAWRDIAEENNLCELTAKPVGSGGWFVGLWIALLHVLWK